MSTKSLDLGKSAAPRFDPNTFIALIRQRRYFLPDLAYLCISRAHFFRIRKRSTPEIFRYEELVASGRTLIEEALTGIVKSAHTLAVTKSLLHHEAVILAVLETAPHDDKYEFSCEDWLACFGMIKVLTASSAVTVFLDLCEDILLPLADLVEELDRAQEHTCGRCANLAVSKGNVSALQHPAQDPTLDPPSESEESRKRESEQESGEAEDVRILPVSRADKATDTIGLLSTPILWSDIEPKPNDTREFTSKLAAVPTSNNAAQSDPTPDIPRKRGSDQDSTGAEDAHSAKRLKPADTSTPGASTSVPPSDVQPELRNAQATTLSSRPLAAVPPRVPRAKLYPRVYGMHGKKWIKPT